MATEISVPSALPIELDFSLPASLPSAKNFEMRLQPINAQSFQSGSVIQFDLPCGRRGQYLDPATSYLRYKITYTHTGTMSTDKSFLLGSSYSPFQKQEVYGNNSVLLESINEVGVLASMMLNVSLNDSDKRGLSSSMGFGYASLNEASATAGHGIFVVNNNTGLEGLTFEYCTPLIGILGSGTDKLFPIGAIYGLRFELTMDNFANFTADATVNGTVSGAVISEIELVSNIIELGADSQALIEMQNPEKIHIRSQSYRQASSYLNASTGVGSNDLLINLRVSSLKSLWMVCNVGNAGNEKKYAAINPNLDQGTCFVISSQNYPQRTLNPSGHPGDCFMELQKSLGALSMSNFNGSVSKKAYYTSSTQYGLCQAFNSDKGTIQTNPNQFYLGVDVEVVARKQSLLSGINVNSSPMFFRAQVGSALSANQHLINFYGYYDLILEIDTMQKSIISKF